MPSSRSLSVLAFALLLVTVGCAGNGAEPLESAQAVTMSPGTNASTAFTLDETQASSLSADNITASSSQDGLSASVTANADGDGGIVGWVSVQATDEASEGDHTVDVNLGGDQRTVSVEVAEPSDPLGQGDIGHLTFTARTLDGELVMTNDENVSQAPHPEHSAFQAAQSFDPAPAQLSERGQLPAELVRSLVGADVGHDREVHIEEFFGPETLEQTRNRETNLTRELTAPVELSYPTQQAGQFLPRDAQQGDEVDVPVDQAGHRVPYILEEVGRQQVQLSLALDQNDTFTLYEPWPNTANVTDVGEEQATIRVEPGVAEGDVLAWNDAWGNVTEVVEVTDEKIVLRHSPEEGLVYEQTDARSGQAVRTEVLEVTDDEIVVEQTNPHPLAGDTVVFSVTIADRGQPQR